VLWCSLQTLSETFLILRRNERDLIISEHGSASKVLDILVRFSRKLNFLEMFSKNTQISNFMKICQWQPIYCMQTDGRTDRHDEANSRFSQFCEKQQKRVALYRGLTVFGETPILCLNVSTSKWPFSCQFQASTSHLRQLNCVMTRCSLVRQYELLLLSRHSVSFKCYCVYSSHFLRWRFW